MEGDGGIATTDYPITIFYSDEDEGWIADIPDLKWRSAFGATPEVALAELERAKSAWLEAAKEEGKPILFPRYHPLIYQAIG